METFQDLQSKIKSTLDLHNKASMHMALISGISSRSSQGKTNTSCRQIKHYLLHCNTHCFSFKKEPKQVHRKVFQSIKYTSQPQVVVFGLRVRAFFHKTVRVCHVYCNFRIDCTCRITVISGTLKDGGLLINTLASNICFSYRNMFQNGIDAL